MYHQTPPLCTPSVAASGDGPLLETTWYYISPKSHSNIPVLLLGILTQGNYVKNIIQNKRKPNIQRYSVRCLQVKPPCSSKNSKQIMT